MLGLFGCSGVEKTSGGTIDGLCLLNYSYWKGKGGGTLNISDCSVSVSAQNSIVSLCYTSLLSCTNIMSYSEVILTNWKDGD